MEVSGSTPDKEMDNVPLLKTHREIEKWDVFSDNTEEIDNGDKATKYFEIAEKVLKVACYLVTFAVIVVSSLVSKGCLLFMTSSIRSPAMSLCSSPSFDLGNDEFYKVKVPEVEKVAWIWCIFFALITPEVLTLYRSLKFCLFKSFSKPTWPTFLWVFVMDSCYAIGIVLLIYGVLPKLDVVKAAMITNCVCLVPAVFTTLSRSWSGCCFKKECFKYCFDLVVIVIQASGFVLLIVWNTSSEQRATLKELPLLFAVLLVSCSFWENYTDNKSPIACMKKLHKIKEELRSCRYIVCLPLSIWKIFLMFSTLLLYVRLSDSKLFEQLFHLSSSLQKEKIEAQWIPPNIYEKVPMDRPVQKLQEETNSMLPIYFALIQITASYVCYIFSTFACAIRIQCFSYAFPLSLTVPLLLSILISACRLRETDDCIFNSISYYLFWTCPKSTTVKTFFINDFGLTWILWLLSQAWITAHIWTPKKDRISKIDKLFVNPYYCAALLDQSLMLNRRREDELQIKYTEFEEDVSRLPRTSVIIEKGFEDRVSDYVTRIYACATMWHEEEAEMIQMLKSIFKMDEDQCARTIAQTYLQAVDVDFYKFEAHIFFDDAFKVEPETRTGVAEVNKYVKSFVSVIGEAAKKVHGKDCVLKPPMKVPTPYGGQLLWILPGENKLIVHLKDKNKIRHKKRWSQVMYMYYLLGHRLMELNVRTTKKSILAMNTYILALDGDIDFEPRAVQLLVDRMKRSPGLGAACGRIHPVGKGAMVCYQKFEYAIGHWFQKATEHMIGCVLCSPGCFSLFRAKALMDDNVMKKYTAQSKEPMHYIQYDQGEDRWLCTLLLQRGYRVEYCAASDAYTHCPENFKDFYIQRRRWAPSTMANIVDLLRGFRQTTAANDNISTLYITYQMMLMVGTILGPGTILLMLNGAMVAAFRLSNIESLMANLLPVSLFIIACFFVKNDTQILIAQVLTACYALLMMAVLVGTAVQLVEDGTGSPAAIFLIATTCSFVLAAILHPKEFWCVVHGVLYFLSVPSMYLLLVLYGFINLNVVSWGTREGTVTTAEQQQDDQVKQDEVTSQNKLDSPLKWFIGEQRNDQDGSFSCGIANLFKCLCCTHPKPNDKKLQLDQIQQQLVTLSKQIGSLEQRLRGRPSQDSPFNKHTSDNEADDELKKESGIDKKAEKKKEAAPSLELSPKQSDSKELAWMEDSSLKDLERLDLPEREIRFWESLIEKYLYPLDRNCDEKQMLIEKEETEQKLKSLRNNVVFGFLMANSLFILIIFLLQVNKDMLFIQWPLGAKYNITYIPASNNIIITPTFQTIEPVGIVFAAFFAVVLFIQFFAMLFHRLQTLTHIMAFTDLNLCSYNMDISGDAYIDKNAVNIVKDMQKLKSKEEQQHQEDFKGPDKIARRPTIHMLDSRAMKKANSGNLKDVFEKRFWNPDFESKGVSLLKSNRKKSALHKEVMSALKRRRSTIQEPLPSQDYSNNQQSTLDDDARRLSRAFGGIDNNGFENSDDDESFSSQIHPSTLPKQVARL